MGLHAAAAGMTWTLPTTPTSSNTASMHGTATTGVYGVGLTCGVSVISELAHMLFPGLDV